MDITDFVKLPFDILVMMFNLTFVVAGVKLSYGALFCFLILLGFFISLFKDWKEWFFLEELVSLIYVEGNNLETIVRMFIVFIAVLVIHSIIKCIGKFN